MRRVVWFAGGVVTGAAGTGYAKRKAVAVADRMRPANVAHSASQALKRGGGRLFGSVHDRVMATARRDRQLGERGGRLVPLQDQLATGDEVLVDGKVVEPGRVVLLRRRHRARRP